MGAGCHDALVGFSPLPHAARWSKTTIGPSSCHLVVRRGGHCPFICCMQVRSACEFELMESSPSYREVRGATGCLVACMAQPVNQGLEGGVVLDLVGIGLSQGLPGGGCWRVPPR